jgi:glycosyltransferase involved in cell wall biosynthesis
VLTDGVACLVAPEPEPFGRGLALLLASEPLRERLAANARRLCQEEFTPEAFARKLLGFYDEVQRTIGDGPAHADSFERREPQAHPHR